MAIGLRQDYEEGSRVIGAIYGAAAPEETRSAASRIINADTVAWIERPRKFRYRGWAYTIERVPWQNGIAIEYIVDRVQALLDMKVDDEKLEELAALLHDGVAMFWRMTKKPWWRFANPFMTIQLGEFFELASFYSECQMRLPDLALDISQGSSQQRASVLRTILPTVWRNSRRRTATRGLESMAGRSASSTSRSAFVGSTLNTVARP